MDWKPRRIADAEVGAITDITSIAFGIGPDASPEYRSDVESTIEADRTFVVEDEGRMVGMGSAFSLDVSLPGGAGLPLAGVTEVGVLPTHRRRGILRALLAAIADQAVQRGEPLAGLTASEGGIYRRFGYGVATRFQALSIDTARSTAIMTTADVGRVRLVTQSEATGFLSSLWDRHRRRCVGEVSRSAGWWRSMALDLEVHRRGASRRFIAVHEDGDAAPDGFVSYRIAENFTPGGVHHELRIEDLAAADDTVEDALWRYVLGVDLVATVTWATAPLDLPLRWQLADPRAVRVEAEGDVLWLRPLDVAHCLAGRRYAADGDLVIGVVDEVRPEVSGTFRLDAGTDGAACTRTAAEPDVATDVATDVASLGSLLLGGVSWATLARAGLVEERAPGAVRRADTLFRPDRAPHCNTDF